MKMHLAHGRAILATLSLLAGACGAAEVESTQSSEKASEDEPAFGLTVSGTATAEDAGLPTYPGSKPYKNDADDSSSAANLGLATRMFGLKVVAMNLETADEPEKVATFYRRALSKYGDILECSDDADGKKKAKSRVAGSDEVVCDPDEPGTHSVVYKVGTESNQRIVAIKPHGRGTRFSLVHVDVRGGSKE